MFGLKLGKGIQDAIYPAERPSFTSAGVAEIKKDKTMQREKDARFAAD